MKSVSLALAVDKPLHRVHWSVAFPLTLALSLRERTLRTFCAPCALESRRRQRRAGVSPAQLTRPRERGRCVGSADGGRRDARPTLRFTGREQQCWSCENSNGAGFADQLATILPLPEGEGRDEGEQRERLSTSYPLEITSSQKIHL